MRVETIQNGEQALERPGVVDVLRLRGQNNQLRRVGHDSFVTKSRSLAVVGSDAQADLVHPSAQRRAPLEFADLPINDEKDFLANILKVGLGHAAMVERPPDLNSVLVDDLP